MAQTPMELVVEGRIRNVWLFKAICYAATPLTVVGVLDGCTVISAARRVLRCDWRFERSGWKRMAIDTDWECIDDEDDGLPVRGQLIT